MWGKTPEISLDTLAIHLKSLFRSQDRDPKCNPGRYDWKAF